MNFFVFNPYPFISRRSINIMTPWQLGVVIHQVYRVTRTRSGKVLA